MTPEQFSEWQSQRPEWISHETAVLAACIKDISDMISYDIGPAIRAKRNGDARQGTALPRQDDSDAQAHDADAVGFGSACRRFPVAAHVGQEATPRLGGFAQRLVAAIAVVTHRRRAHEQPRALRRGQAGQGAHQRLGGIDAATADTPASSRGESAGEDRLARQMDDRGALRRRRFRRRDPIPFETGDVAAQTLRRGSRVAGEGAHGTGVCGPRLAEAPAHQARRPRDENGLRA